MAGGGARPGLKRRFRLCQPQVADANSQLLDSLAVVLLQHPAVLLRVAVPANGADDELLELARQRELAIVGALRSRGVPEGRTFSATSAAGGQPASLQAQQLELHALAVAAAAAAPGADPAAEAAVAERLAARTAAAAELGARRKAQLEAVRRE